MNIALAVQLSVGGGNSIFPNTFPNTVVSSHLNSVLGEHSKRDKHMVSIIPVNMNPLDSKRRSTVFLLPASFW